MRASLTIEEKGARRRYELDGPVLVGRDADCHIVVSDPTVSRKHASLVAGEGGWTLRDLGSGNGTFLDGKRVDESAVAGGELIRFGGITARFEQVEGEPLTASQKIQRTLSQTLSIKPARRTRPKAVVVAIVAGVLALLVATAYHRSRMAEAAPPPDRAAPASTR